jgi:predicted acetyltransferase
VLAVIGRVHQALRDCGPNTRDEAAVARWLGDEQRFAYLAPDGFLAYRWQNGNDELLVDRALGSSAAATRAIWGVVASHSSIAQIVRATVGPADPVQWLTTDPDVRQSGRSAWMLRVLDASAAVAGRGFPAGVGLTAVLRLDDPDRPACEGWWTLDVNGGQGTLTASEAVPDALTLGPRGFAALYAGTPLATLRRAGLAAGGDPGGDDALDAAFGADPFMLEFF